MPSSAGSAEVSVPSAATWQAAPDGQAPSRIAARPAVRPDSSTARSRGAAARDGAAIRTAADTAGAPGWSSPVSWKPDRRAWRTTAASAWLSAASREGVMIRPGMPPPAAM